jgi:hypothetical protein
MTFLAFRLRWSRGESYAKARLQRETLAAGVVC